MDYKNTIHDVLGIKEVLLTKDKVILSMPVNKNTHQPFGMLHGGASVVLAESAASIGSLLNISDQEFPVGIEINANHIKGKKSGVVYASATPLHRGKSTMVWDIRTTDEEDQLISIARCTIAIHKKR